MMSRTHLLLTEQIEHFHREGYVMAPDIFMDADLQPVRDEITAEIDRRARDLVKQGVLTDTYAEHPFETRLAQISRETDQVARSIWNGVLSGPAFFNLIRHPKLLDIAEQLCGPELIASSVYRLRPKIPHYNYGAVPWHQDSSYFEPYCDRALVLTVWLPLVDATSENGCLWVLPRVHRNETLLHHTASANGGYLQIPEEQLPPDIQQVCVPVPKGGVLLLTNRTPHVSYENTTDTVRWSMDLRYQSAALPTNAGISRLEGESVPDVEQGIPLACYPPEADFLVRSRTRPHEVLDDARKFHALRQNHLAKPVTDRWSAHWEAINQ
jgi:ectoine hydroxylase-related dioxygenase (phytanoyl-CoA dioxygenase family)